MHKNFANRETVFDNREKFVKIPSKRLQKLKKYVTMNLIGFIERRINSMLLASTVPSLGLVIGMGLGIVFVGLICIIFICYMMSKVVRLLEGKKESEPAAAPVAAPVAAPAPASPVANRQELVAVIACAIAEELGTDVSAIRIKSIKQL